ncbi:hypothetical protein EVAR_21180_1 [Eumeta japonica]|uniref:Uncharacterized protein n=1 Tax=Eumeta variegata TaxID=151549 RepID=A0A4C1UPB6_EUMVA|nr:hypothetical protein EVAR_21180_1 [Eumeta japonica]
MMIHHFPILSPYWCQRSWVAPTRTVSPKDALISTRYLLVAVCLPFGNKFVVKRRAVATAQAAWRNGVVPA